MEKTVRVTPDKVTEVLNDQQEIVAFDVMVPDQPAGNAGGKSTPEFIEGIPATNDDGTVGSTFTTEEEAFQQAVKFTKIANAAGDGSSFCSTDDVAGDRFGTVRVTAVGFKKIRCQPAVVSQDAATQRDNANADQLKKDLANDVTGGRGGR